MDLAPKRALVLGAGVLVVAAHAFALWLWVKAETPPEVVKRPDLSIEFYTPPPVRAVAASAVPSTPPPKKPAPAPAPARVAPAPVPPPVTTAQPVQKVSPLAERPEPLKQALVQQAKPTEPAAQEAPNTAPSDLALPLEQPATTEATPAAPATAAVQEPVMATAATVDADYKAAYLNNPKPPYPRVAMRKRAEGQVILLAQVLPDGRAGAVRLERSSGHAILDAAAMNTVRLWRFTPARKDGVFLTQTVRIPIDFKLQEGR
jgi:periplasmic protein TonB